MKILLVEDNVSLCRNIASVLQNEGYTVVTCSNGNEAEFQMLNNSSDLILLDRMLPGKDGITLTREARAAGITVPILLLTALDTLGDKVTGLDAGADDYIVKPFAMEELLARLRIWSRRTVSLEDPGELCFGDLSYRPSVRQLSGPAGKEVLPKRLAQLIEQFRKEVNNHENNARQGVGLSAGRVRHARGVFRLPCIFGSHVFGIGNHQRFFCSAGQRVIDNTDSANQ